MMSDIELFRDSALRLTSEVTPEKIEGTVARLREALDAALDAINNGSSPLHEPVAICRGCGKDADVNAAFARCLPIINGHATLRYSWFDPTPINELVELIRLWDFGGFDPEIAAKFPLSFDKAYDALLLLHYASHLERCPGCRADYGFKDHPSLSTIEVESRPKPKKRDPAPPPPLVLGGEDDDPIVNGRKKPRLTPGQYRVVRVLMDASPEKISKDSLAVRSNTEDPVGMIDRLRRDKDWASVLIKPGKPHGGYGIRLHAEKRAQKPRNATTKA